MLTVSEPAPLTKKQLLGTARVYNISHSQKGHCDKGDIDIRHFGKLLSRLQAAGNKCGLSLLTHETIYRTEALRRLRARSGTKDGFSRVDRRSVYRDTTECR